MNISDEGIALIKKFEGCRLTSYPDPATGGVPWTIGYGSTFNVHPGMTITAADAEARLRMDLSQFERGVTVAVAGKPTTQHQFDAMVSFAFNVGLENLRNSTLLRKHCTGDFAGAAEQFSRWTKAAGKVMSGLVRRRAAEALLYTESGE